MFSFFKKRVRVGQADIEKEIWDWDAILGIALLALFIVGLLSKCS